MFTSVPRRANTIGSMNASNDNGFSLRLVAALMMGVALVAACGGSGDSPSSSPAPAPAPAPPPGSGTAPSPAPAPSASATAFDAIDTTSRAQVVARYWDGFVPLRNTAFSWTGNVAGCVAGDTTLDYKNAVTRLVNYYRAMAGVPSDVGLSLAKSAKAQQAALMFDANDALSHTPPSSWTCYTAAGAEAAGNSNIAWASPTLNGSSIGAVPMYVIDGGVSSLGHRRWVLYAKLGELGTGDAPQGNALWVLGGDRSAAVSVPNGVAWPPRGFVPWDSSIAEPSIRWSFSYPAADFSAATVSMNDDAGAAVPVSAVESLPNGYADNTVAWSIGGSGTAWSRYPGDTQLSVTVSNVKVGGSAKTFSYDVIFVKP